MSREVKPGVYRHFKGKCYEVICIAEHTETGEKLVIYKAMYGEQKLWVRHYDMLVSEVDREKYPDAGQRYRFEYVGDDEPIDGETQKDDGWICETCIYYPPSSLGRKPCSYCDPDNPLMNCYSRREDL